MIAFHFIMILGGYYCVTHGWKTRRHGNIYLVPFGMAMLGLEALFLWAYIWHYQRGN